jgi:hypothetical protein
MIIFSPSCQQSSNVPKVFHLPRLHSTIQKLVFGESQDNGLALVVRRHEMLLHIHLQM